MRGRRGAGSLAIPKIHKQEELTLEHTSLIQAAAVIAGGMAGAQYGKYSVLETSRITDIASLAVELARAIETEAKKQS
jgi:hypothetical protein